MRLQYNGEVVTGVVATAVHQLLQQTSILELYFAQILSTVLAHGACAKATAKSNLVMKDKCSTMYSGTS